MINWLSNIKPIKAIGMILGLLLLSYIFVHLFAILGIFVAIGFPLLWMLFPQFTACVYCRNTPVGKRCHSCRQVVDNKISPPKNFRSVIINSLTILLVSVISSGAVYLEYKILENYHTIEDKEIVEFIIPEKKQYKIHEIFPVDLDVNTNNVSINAIQTDLSFDTEIAEIVKVSLENSFSQIFIQNEINNEKGYVRITGGLPNPGFNGNNGHFCTIYFKAKKAGLLEISYLPSSLVLANNGSGTNILKSYPTLSYIIKPEYISETEKEIQDAIYYSSNVLGVESNDNQILLFGEEDELVLGVDAENLVTEEEIVEKEPFSLSKFVFKIDSWIVNFFKSLLGIFLQ